MTVLVPYDDSLESYRLSPTHPMQPERFALAFELIGAWGMLCGGPDKRVDCVRVTAPEPATDDMLSLAHTAEYIAFVKHASENPEGVSGMGIGPGDTPAFTGMHHAASLAVGASISALDAVLEEQFRHAFNPAGGLHHAHRDRASGFCVYNDCVAAIEHAAQEHPGIRIAYVDVDAHHGDGVEAAFRQRADVLTLSVHESGQYLFPGTGAADDIGDGPGAGATINVPLPPYAGPESYKLVGRDVIEPAVTSFGPDVIVAQIGADSHRGDPLTHLHQSVAGFYEVVSAIISLADRVCEGRLVLLGGGGYQPYSVVPRMWAGAAALLLGRDVPERLPAEWIERAEDVARGRGVALPHMTGTTEEIVPDVSEDVRLNTLALTEESIRLVKEASPLLGATG